MQQEFKAEMRANKYLFMKTQIPILNFSQNNCTGRMFLICALYFRICFHSRKTECLESGLWKTFVHKRRVYVCVQWKAVDINTSLWNKSSWNFILHNKWVNIFTRRKSSLIFANLKNNMGQLYRGLLFTKCIVLEIHFVIGLIVRLSRFSDLFNLNSE